MVILALRLHLNRDTVELGMAVVRLLLLVFNSQDVVLCE